MSRSRSRARKRAFEKKSWAEKRETKNRGENKATRKAHTPNKPAWVAVVESSGSQTIGKTKGQSGLTRTQRRENRAFRKSRPRVHNPHTDYVRQTRIDQRAELMNGAGTVKVLTTPVGVIKRASLLVKPERKSADLYMRHPLQLR